MSNPKQVAFWLLFIPLVGLALLKQQELSKPLLDLGVAYYPADSSQAYQHTEHRWSAPQLPARYQLVYAHSTLAIDAAYADHQRLAQAFNYQAMEGDQFTWYYRADCIDRWGLQLEQVWACVYSEMLANDQADLRPILQRLREAFAAEGLSTTEAARWLLALVQAIPYRIPHDSPFGVLPPALVASEKWGDCDSKSLLLVYLLRGVGIDAQILTSVAHKHAMVAIDVPVSTSRYFNHYGRRYVWAETTSKAPLGWVDPGMLAPNDWKLVPVVVKPGALRS